MRRRSFIQICASAVMGACFSLMPALCGDEPGIAEDAGLILFTDPKGDAPAGMRRFGLDLTTFRFCQS